MRGYSRFFLAAGVGLVLTRATADDVTDIVITEVMYNPASGQREEDFIELHNMSSTESYNLAGFSFTSGLVFTFPAVTIGPKQYLVVCADATRIRQIYGITNTVGNWDATSSLDNGGERIKIINTSAIEVEDFIYDDRSPWPILADGYGHSLERRNPAFDNDNPANWAASGGAGAWTRVTVTGLATSARLYLYMSGAGTAYVDDVKMYPVGNPGDDRIQNGTFESGSLAPWTVNGNHSTSAITTEEARNGTRSLKIVATGAGTGATAGIVQDGLGLVTNDQYTLEFWVRFESPGATLIARLSGSDQDSEFFKEAGGGSATPGAQNSVFATDLPPFVYPGNHSPQAPASSSQMTLVASVSDDFGIGAVTAHFDRGAGEQVRDMFDDGAHGDGAAGDGIYGVQIGTFPTGTIVRYWFTATDDASQTGRYPFEGNPTPALGFYIQPSGINPTFPLVSNSGLTSSGPPVYHILLPASELDASGHLNGDLTRYRRGTFVYNGEVFDNVRIRHHGQSSLGTSKKHWKIDFNKDHRFRTPFTNHSEVDNINIESSYGDKTFLREFLSYGAWFRAGWPGLEMWHVRMYLNGQYRGLYIHEENPNEDWLDRTGLDSEGWLWKSYTTAQGGTGGFEIKVDGGNAAAANAALGSFVSNMNTLTGQALVNYINANMDVDSFRDFLALIQLIHDCDHPAKNYVVYADEDAPAGSWTYYLWDGDLTHGRNFECAGGGVYNDTIRHDMFNDPQLLFGTSAKPKCDGPWNGIINGFLNRTTAFRQGYYERVSELLEELYAPGVIHPMIDELAAPLASEADLDWNRNTPYGTRSTHAFHVNQLKTSYIQNRYNYLSQRLAVLLGAPDVDNLACSRSGNNAVLSWANHGPYDSIRIYRNNSLLSTAAGNATGATVALDLGSTVNSFRVASVVGGSERSGVSCSIIISSGGYTKVIDEDFAPPAPTSRLAVNCNAGQVTNVLQLTEPAGSQAGSAFFLDRFSTKDFIADFDLRFDEPSAPGADGMVFIINTGNETGICGGAGGALGYFVADAGAPTFPGFAILFDTWLNEGEPSHNWAGFVDAARGAAPQRAVDVPEEFTGNGTFHATVIGKNGTFTLLLSNASAGMPEREIFTHTVPGFVPSNAYFGFSAGTGGAVSRHIVDNFVLQVNTGTPDPVVAAFNGSPRSGTLPLEVTFTNASTGAESFLWTFGDGQTSNERSPTHLYSEEGTYTVSLRATGPGGTNTKTEPDYIVVRPTVRADFTANPTVGSASLQVVFTNQSTGATSYTWDFGDGATSNLVSPTHSYTAGGEYTVSLTARGSGGVEDTRTRTNYIQVDGIIDAEFNANPRSGQGPLTVQFVDASVGNITSWLWDFGDGSTSTEGSPSHTYMENGVYDVSLQVFGFSASDAETKTGFVRVGVSGEPTFSRGEANGDGRTDISDAVYTLSYLFLGGIAPNCLDALDTDDTGTLDLTDAVRLLVYLFQGGLPPEPPFPEPGEDPTVDALDECTRGD